MTFKHFVSFSETVSESQIKATKEESQATPKTEISEEKPATTAKTTNVQDGVNDPTKEKG